VSEETRQKLLEAKEQLRAALEKEFAGLLNRPAALVPSILEGMIFNPIRKFAANPSDKEQIWKSLLYSTCCLGAFDLTQRFHERAGLPMPSNPRETQEKSASVVDDSWDKMESLLSRFE
jgi:hypothetical protein